MATRAAYRASLNNKLLALEDGGYGDFEYSIAELNTYLELSVLRMFPAVYRRLSADGVTTEAYGTRGFRRTVTLTVDMSRIYLVESEPELVPLSGWRIRGSRVVELPEGTDLVNVHYIAPYLMPGDDTTDAGIPEVYATLVTLGALIEALEARQDTGVRGEPPPTGPYFTTQLLDRLRPRYERLLEEQAMGLPSVGT